MDARSLKKQFLAWPEQFASLPGKEKTLPVDASSVNRFNELLKLAQASFPSGQGIPYPKPYSGGVIARPPYADFAAAAEQVCRILDEYDRPLGPSAG